MPQLIDLWDRGENSFKDDPPNASLNATNLDPLVIEMIKKPIYNEQNNSFEFKFIVSSVVVPAGVYSEVSATMDNNLYWSFEGSSRE
jgi:hypothetical protein